MPNGRWSPGLTHQRSRLPCWTYTRPMTVLLLCAPCSPGPDGLRDCGRCRGCDCLDDAHSVDELEARMRRLAPTEDELVDEVVAALRGRHVSAAAVTAQLLGAGFRADTVAAVVEKLGLDVAGSS